MSARQLQIQSRTRANVLSELANFEWTDAGAFDASTLVDDPTLSLYCLDEARQWAVFVKLPASIRLDGASFVYQVQFDHAEYLVALPYVDFLAIADSLHVDPDKLVCLHNIARCGSTLLSQVLNQAEGVIAYSEPDAFANLVALRQTVPHDQQLTFLRACFRWTFRPVLMGDATHYILKLRSQSVDMLDLYVDAFPTATHLFMYRNAVDWVASLYRFIVRSGRETLTFSREEAIAIQARFFNRTPEDTAPFFDPTVDTVSLIRIRMISWLIMMTRYMELYQQGIHLPAIRYEDLTAQPDKLLQSLTQLLGLPQASIPAMRVAFEHDSQAGTRMARDHAGSGNTLQLATDAQTMLYALLAEHLVVNHPDFILPMTVT